MSSVETRSAPVKRVHNSRMVAHLWSNQSQAEARNSGNTFFFDGETIFSYGSHFPISRIVKNTRGEMAALFNPGSYSITTSHHQSMARCAARHLTQFRVPSLGEKWKGHTPCHKDNVRYYQDRIREAAMTVRRAKSQRGWKVDALERLVAEANEYSAFFRLRTRFKVPSDKDVQAAIDKARREAEQRRQRELERKQRALEEAQESIARWKAGEQVHIPWHISEVFLRVREKDGEKILETSKCAEVPLDHAKRILPRIRSGVPYRHNGHTIYAGHFRIDAIDTEGNLKAGCHFIKRGEIERIAAQLGL
jgi:hypothetical protein